MNLRIDYNESNRQAIISAFEMENFSWEAICRLTKDECSNVIIRGNMMAIPWHVFLSYKARFASIVKNIHKTTLELSDNAMRELSNAAQIGYYSSIKNPLITEEQLKTRLNDIGFQRKLTDKQIRNVCKLASLPAGASFSVPGAGKTTEALAYFFYHAEESDRLLVVAPKNAFGAWDEQLLDCVGDKYGFFKRLRGGSQTIEQKLSQDPRFSIITYQQFPRVKEIITKYLSSGPVFVFLDESHRIKSGSQGVSADAILSSAYLPTRKLILSGTPMPQSESDLDPQLSFLYPDISIADGAAQTLIKPIYVRTTKSELGLPKIDVRTVPLALRPKQQFFYELLRSETNRHVQGVSRSNRFFLRKLGKSIIKLMQFVSNPALLASDIDYMFNSALSELLMIENSVKIEYACSRARELAKNDQKTIIWSSFVDNVELIARHLSDIGADFIHGGVDAGSEEDADTREGKIKRFHDDKNAMVLIANPAAASEGISLHTVCHNAIYVDRSFNAAQYLQSVDRIHRYGLDKNTQTTVEILECVSTVDQIASSRLYEKISRMANVLDDQSLIVSADPYAFDNDIEACGIDESDIDEIMQYLGGAYEND